MVGKSLNAYLLVTRTGVPHWIVPGLCGINVFFFNLKSSLFFFFLKMQMRMALTSAGFEEQRLPVALGVMTQGRQSRWRVAHSQEQGANP